jgi:DNA-binding transcriptional regulator GbsR (MarR family)
MIPNYQSIIVSKKLKEIENQIIDFYIGIGNILDLNKTLTKVFGYFKIYQTLTQDELKILTNFSSSTISTSLHSFLNTNIVTKEKIPNQRKYVYRIKDEKVSFIYVIFSQIIEDLNNLDFLIVNYQKETLNFIDKYPNIVEYFTLCLNSLRNYIEAQRRAINGKKQFSFFEESTNKISISNEIIDYPEEIKQIEGNLINDILEGNYFSINDPIRNKIFSYITTRQKFDQDMLMNLTGFSRSTISRVLYYYSNEEFIKTLPREFRKSQIYYQDSISLAIINVILKSDYFIFSWIPKFENMLEELGVNYQYTKDKKACDFLKKRIKKILTEIEELKPSSKLLEQAKHELQDFLGL